MKVFAERGPAAAIFEEGSFGVDDRGRELGIFVGKGLILVHLW